MILRANLNKLISPEAFEKVWNEWSEPGSPPVHFQFEEQGVIIQVPATPWDEASLKRTFQMMLHRVDRDCDATWI